VPYGPARLDAFGAIINSVDGALGAPPSGPARAPVSYPCIWDAGHMDRVQWNGSAFNDPRGRLGRNVGEVLGVFGHLEQPTADRAMPSSVNVEGLVALEKMMLELRSPVWPASLPQPDSAKVDAGKKLYGQYCVACHQRDDGDAERKFQAAMVPQCQVGTDPQMLQQIAERRSGLERVVQSVGGVLLARPCSVLQATGAAVPEPCDDAVLRGQLLEQQKVAAALEPPVDPCADPASCYKAGPLHGVWATAPYLHNGSVPNLWQLLLPPKKRVREFRVGSPEIDPVHVGFRSDAPSGAFVFRTGLAGNSSAGHAYGTQLSDAERWALIEYMKTL
jgi:mono/diheme cytochrome c family protein